MIKKVENIILKKRLRKRSEKLKGRMNASGGERQRTGT